MGTRSSFPLRFRLLLICLLLSTPLPAIAQVAAGGTGTVRGTVRDSQGEALADVPVDAACGFRRQHVQTDPAGRFELAGLPEGPCVISSLSMLLAAAEERVDVQPDATRTVDLILLVRSFGDVVAVTATRGTSEARFESPQHTSVVTSDELAMRPYYLMPQALRDQPGILVQQTTTAQASPVIRGFTGQGNVYLVDGVRFNVSTWRPGPSQYLAWIDGAAVDRLEIVRGPSAVQYGSDSLGGAINVITAAPDFTQTGVRVSGAVEVGATTAATSGNGQAHVSIQAPKAAFLLGGTHMNVGDLRPGRGVDSHAAVTRFLGLTSESVSGTRLPSSGYEQSGAFASARLQAGGRALVSAFYAHEAQTGSSRYDRIAGGDGLFRSGFDPQTLDFGTLRADVSRVAGFDDVIATLSVNRQGDGRFEQTRPTAVLDRQSAVTTALGYQLEARRRHKRHSVSLGAEYFDEDISAERVQINPITTVATANRPDVPNGTTYGSLGAFAHSIFALVPGRVSIRGGLRYGRFVFATKADPVLGVTRERVQSDAVTFNVGTVIALSSSLNATFNLSRGFRAPNAADFGSVGLTGGGGFEVAPSTAAELGGMVASSGVAGARSTGIAIPALGPEVVYAFEPGLRLRAGRVDASVTAFDIEYLDAIERRAVAFDRDIVGATISGFEIVRQDAFGLAFIAQDIRPVATRVNTGHARLLGFEAEGRVRLTTRLALHAQTSMTNGRLLDTGEYLRRMPPPLGSAGVRWSTDRLVVDGTVNLAARQTRLNPGDLTDSRIGGVRTRASIASFFNGTATDMGLVAGGLLLQTGETLAQVQTRVLGDATSAPLYSSAPGFAVLGARINAKLSSRVNLIVIGENLTDRNYRLYGSGADAPGANLQVRIRARF
ncbi:MAG: TonB-dependent receptor [Vicinamibacterales bacterium]|nr:TonB-dependent receptor [Vicinamibacterales bacterium]